MSRTAALGALLLLLALGVAGCTTTTNPRTSGTPTPFGTCPSWIENRAADRYTGVYSPRNNETHFENLMTLTDDRLEMDGHPLDIIQVDFYWREMDGKLEPNGIVVQDGGVTGQFRRASDNATLHTFLLNEDDPGASRDAWTFGQGRHGNFTIQVTLAQPDEEPAPTRVRADWDLRRNLDGNPTTPSNAGIQYRIHYLYRTCGADGKPT